MACAGINKCCSHFITDETAITPEICEIPINRKKDDAKIEKLANISTIMSGFCAEIEKNMCIPTTTVFRRKVADMIALSTDMPDQLAKTIQKYVIENLIIQAYLIQSEKTENLAHHNTENVRVSITGG